jgi:hypothetical protein
MRVDVTVRTSPEPSFRHVSQPSPGRLIVNADDWGRTHDTTERILACRLRGSVSSVSAMVFMEDSERAAAIAREHGIDAGLHLNFITEFSARAVSPQLILQHTRLIRFLRRHRFAQTLYHPGLARCFAYVVEAQHDEYLRLYKTEPKRYDGHHHMHLCANVLMQRLLPAGAIVRRNFSFHPGEKGRLNRLYRRIVDRALAKRHHLTDYFFSLPPLSPLVRLERIFALGRKAVVEVETHPINPEEFTFLTEGAVLHCAGDVPIASRFDIPFHAVSGMSRAPEAS